MSPKTPPIGRSLLRRICRNRFVNRHLRRLTRCSARHRKAVNLSEAITSRQLSGWEFVIFFTKSSKAFYFFDLRRKGANLSSIEGSMNAAWVLVYWSIMSFCVSERPPSARKLLIHKVLHRMASKHAHWSASLEKSPRRCVFLRFEYIKTKTESADRASQ